MAEAGFPLFARIALDIRKAVLPRYRSRFPKHSFTQPQFVYASAPGHAARPELQSVPAVALPPFPRGCQQSQTGSTLFRG